MLRRCRLVARVIAVVLLTWTAADLAYPQCCLRDAISNRDSGMATASLSAASADCDDCFCCARCVDTGVRTPELRVSAAWVDFAEPIRHLADRPSSLDHPPQNA